MLLQGRPARLYVLDYGLFRVHANGRVIGICGFAIQTDAGETVLIDGGFPAKYTRDPTAATQEDILYDFGEVLDCRPDHLPAAQLARAGIAEVDITLNILSHSHIDHLGALDLAPQAPLLMSQAERALPKPIYWSGLHPLDWPDRHIITLDQDTQIGPDFTVLQTPGHAPGQIAFLITLPKTGPVLLTSDAISRPSEIDEQFDTAPDPKTAIQSANRILTMAHECGAFILYGHCPAQWPHLRKAPEYYA